MLSKIAYLSLLLFLVNPIEAPAQTTPSNYHFPTSTTVPATPATPAPTAPVQTTPAPTAPAKPPRLRQYYNPEDKNSSAPVPFPSQTALPPQFTAQDAQNILEVIENQLSAIQARNYKKAFLEYTSQSLQSRTSQEEFDYYVQHYSVLNNNKNALFGLPELFHHEVLLKGILTSMDGASYKAEYHLVKEGNQWKVQGLQLIPSTAPSEGPKPVPGGCQL